VSIIRCFALILAVLPMFSVALSADEKPLSTVEHVDLQKYLGTWFEIARIEQRFQKGCFDSSAEYSLRDDGDIQVVNSCSLVGKKDRKSATGRAWITDEDTNAKLRVQFVLTGLKLSFLSGRYWILDLAPDYSHALVGEPSREYLWLLSRSPEMPAEKIDAILAKAEALGYDRSEILLNSSLRP